jgi:acylphosphatase
VQFGGAVLGWIRNNKDGFVEMLADAADENVLQALLAFAVAEAERWLAVVVTVERIESAAGGAKLKALMWGTRGVPCEANKSNEMTRNLHDSDRPEEGSVMFAGRKDRKDKADKKVDDKDKKPVKEDKKVPATTSGPASVGAVKLKPVKKQGEEPRPVFFSF